MAIERDRTGRPMGILPRRGFHPPDTGLPWWDSYRAPEGTWTDRMDASGWLVFPRYGQTSNRRPPAPMPDFIDPSDEVPPSGFTRQDQPLGIPTSGWNPLAVSPTLMLLRSLSHKIRGR